MDTKIHISHVIPVMSREHKKFMEQAMLQEMPHLEFSGFDSIPELFPWLSNRFFNTDYVVVDIEQLYAIDGAECFELLTALKTLIKCTVYRPTLDGKPIQRTTKIVGLVGAETDPKLVRCTMKLLDGVGVRDSGGWTIQDAIADVKKYTSGDLSVPKLVKDLLTKKKPKIIPNDEIQLTNRQEQIYNLVVSTGSSNKTIAKSLGIAESTVKLHLSNVFKKYGVKNRTQLAAFAKNT